MYEFTDGKVIIETDADSLYQSIATALPSADDAGSRLGVIHLCGRRTENKEEYFAEATDSYRMSRGCFTNRVCTDFSLCISPIDAKVIMSLLKLEGGGVTVTANDTDVEFKFGTALYRVSLIAFKFPTLDGIIPKAGDVVNAPAGSIARALTASNSVASEYKRVKMSVSDAIVINSTGDFGDVRAEVEINEGDFGTEKTAQYNQSYLLKAIKSFGNGGVKIGINERGIIALENSIQTHVIMPQQG